MPLWLYPVLALAAILVLLIVIVTIRTLLFRPRKKKALDVTPVTVDSLRSLATTIL